MRKMICKAILIAAVAATPAAAGVPVTTSVSDAPGVSADPATSAAATTDVRSPHTLPEGVTAVDAVLESVEKNNATLVSRRRLTEAQSLEARTGNSLENPEVEFGYNWGDPSSLGKNGEVTVSQAFDFPSAYVYRNRVARQRAEQYGHEYAAYRQQVLLEAQSLCIEIIALRMQDGLLAEAMRNGERSVEVVERRFAAGDANSLERNKAQFELIAARNAYKLNEIDLRAAERQLVVLNGGEPVVFTPSEFPMRPQLRPREEVLDYYEHASPELLALVNERNAAHQELKLSRSAALPKLSLGYKHEFSSDEKFNGVVVGMSIPMFGNRFNVKRAKAQSEFAESEYRSGAITLRSQTEQLYERAGLLAQSLDEYRGIAERAHSAELLNKALAAGQISVSDYFDELQPIYEVYLTLVAVERDYHLACAQINMIYL